MIKARMVQPIHTSARFLSQNLMVVVLMLFLVAGALLSDRFLTADNLLGVLRQMSVVGVLAAGQSIVIMSGGIDLAVGGLLSASVIMIALLQDFPFPLLILLAAVFGIAMHTVTGTMIAYGRLPPFIATLAVGTAGEGLAFLLSEGRPIFIRQHADAFRTIGSGRVMGIPVMVVVFVALVILGQMILSSTSVGVYWRAVGGNELATHWSGVNTRVHKLLAYAASGFMVGMAGLLAVSRTGVGDPVVGQGLALDSISAAVLGGTYVGGGGKGSVLGTLMGAFILGVINNLFNLLNISTYWQLIAKGVIIAIAVYLGGHKSSTRT